MSQGQSEAEAASKNGVWWVKTARVVPDNEKWLHRPGELAKLKRAIEWAENHPSEASDLAAIERKLKRKFKLR